MKINTYSNILTVICSFIMVGCTEDTNSPPTVVTKEIIMIRGISAISGGEIIATGGQNPTSIGVVWDVNPNPTIDLTTKTSDNTLISDYQSQITNLTPNTTYYVRAYATNNNGTAYGNQLSFIAIDPDIETGLIAYYPFNNNILDESGLNHHGSISNNLISTTNRFNEPNKAFKFNGNNSFIKVPHYSTFTGTLTQLSVSSWVKIDQFTGNINKAASILDKSNNNPGDWGLYYQDFDANPSNEQLRFGGYMRVGNTFLSQGLHTNTIPNINQWVFLTFTIDGNSGTKYYINGQLESAVENGGNSFTLWNNLQDLYIGKSSLDTGNYYGISGSNGNFFNGAIDDIRVYNKVLNANEIDFLYTHFQ
jgi:hypothetical protein